MTIAVLLAGCRERGVDPVPELPIKKPLEEVQKILTRAPKDPPPVEEGTPPADETAPAKDPDEIPADIPEAAAVPGKPGFVFSPYNEKVIDVRELPVGTLVADPEFEPEEKKYFRVPEPIEEAPEAPEAAGEAAEPDDTASEEPGVEEAGGPEQP